MQLVFSAAPKHSPYLFQMARRETDPVRIYYYSHWSSFLNSPAGAFSRRSFLIGGLIRLVPVSYGRYLILKRFCDGLALLLNKFKQMHQATLPPPSGMAWICSISLPIIEAPSHSPYLFRMVRRETDPVRIYYYQLTF